MTESTTSESLSVLLSEDALHNAPLKEPERQYYFINLLKNAVGRNCRKADCPEGGPAFLSQEDHRPSSRVVTFGCQMNARDSEKLEGILSEIGFEPAGTEEQADLVIFNTCTVRENANEHLYGRLGHLKHVKADRPGMIIAVCGCMMQEPDEVDKLKNRYPFVDIMFGTHNLYTFPELLFTLLRKRRGVFDGTDGMAAAGKGILKDSADDALKYDKLLRYRGDAGNRDIEKLRKRPVISVWKDSSDIVESMPSKRKYPFKQGVNIMFGCDNFCSYCIVPYVRGREKSRAPAEIYEEIRAAGSSGVKEIMLLGQNVNSYAGGIDFPELLLNVDKLCDDTGIERVRFMTSHPKDLSDRLIEAIAASKHVCRQFHLPLQSGSDRILKLMNRHYDKARFLERAERLKSFCPDISLSTDIIVGFPGEKEEDFSETLDVLSKVRFDSAYTFIYSKREGTPAASMPENADEAEIKERFSRLLTLQNKISSENLAEDVGKIREVLFEEVSGHDENLLTGTLESGVTVHVNAPPEYIGKIKKVKLTENHGFYYTGCMV